MRPFHAPYCVYRKQTKAGYYWYVRFWDSATRNYSRIRSTGIPVKEKGEGRHAAEEAARSMLPGIRFTPVAPNVGDTPLLQYLADFWKDSSPYVRECAQVKKKPLSARYLRGHRDDTRLHLEPFPGFQGIILRQLTPGLIRDWMTWAAERGLKGGRINKVMEAMRGAVKYAFQREKISRDPFRNIGKAPDTREEKGVLTPAELAALVRAPVTDPQGRLAVLLGALCGLRLGEVRGLLWAGQTHLTPKEEEGSVIVLH
jgi:hypothetical protein